MPGTAKPGRVRRIRIEAIETPAFEGEHFGPTGCYELINGHALCECDPRHPLNAGIVNLARAARNSRGQVEYEFDFCILKPAAPGRGNGWLLYELPNRGNKLAIGRINRVLASNLLARREHAGDGLLMRRGFTMVWSAWQADVTPGNHRMLAKLPIARGEIGPITGCCRDEFIAEPSNPVNEAINESTDGRFVAALSYPAAALDSACATLTVRERERDPRSRPADLAWRFLDEKHIEVKRPAGFDRGAIYEFIYTARDPIVMGVGLAGIRDFVSFLRHEPRDEEGNPNPLGEGRAQIRHALAFGASQSGRVLRDFLYEGFNQDGEARPVFDAMLPVVTGSRRSFLNASFAQPARFSRQHEDHSFAGDQFPFTYPVLRDRLSGRTDGILARALEAGVCPRIAHLEVETELWAGRSSLLVTDCEGRDIAMPENVRVYLANGIPHAVYPPPGGTAKYAYNPLPYSFALRAVLIALIEWAEGAAAPPPSAFPSRAAGTLVDIEFARARFAAISAAQFPCALNELRLRDHSVEPPAEGPAYPVFVALADADGNSLGGIRHPLLEAPIATLTGWNLRERGFAEGELYGIIGAIFPFAASAEERRESGDPRPSLQERYGTPAAWARAIAAAANALAARRLLLPEDAARIVAAAEKGWTVADFT